jgi:hypothetical protein
MKHIRIIALVTVLAIAFTLSAQAQAQNTTSSDQNTAQSTSQTALAFVSPANGSMSAQQSQDTASNTSNNGRKHISILRRIFDTDSPKDDGTGRITLATVGGGGGAGGR